jgi:hypothetical protein
MMQKNPINFVYLSDGRFALLKQATILLGGDGV